MRLLVDQDGRPSVTVGELGGPDPGPVAVVIDTEPTPSDDPFVRHKTTQRARYEAAAARHPGAGDVVLVNEHGQVTETTIANLAARFGDRWVTPPLASGCLPGTARAQLLADGVMVEGELWPEDLHRADELARFNAVRGWQPIVLEP